MGSPLNFCAEVLIAGKAEVLRWPMPLSHNPRLKDPLFLGALDHGVRLAFETDRTVAPLNPLLTVMRIPTRSTTSCSTCLCPLEKQLMLRLARQTQNGRRRTEDL